MKTGTTTLGIVCKDGIVLAADKRATVGHMIANKQADKVQIITDDVTLTLAGAIADAQLMIKLIKAELKLKEVRTYKKPSMKETANLISGLLYNNIRRPSMMPGVVHFLVGGKDSEGVHLYDCFPDGTVTKIPDYISSGSGSVFVYGVLETHYTPEITTSEAVKLAVKSVNTALQRDSASGNGIDVVVITKDAIKPVLHKELKCEL